MWSVLLITSPEGFGPRIFIRVMKINAGFFDAFFPDFLWISMPLRDYFLTFHSSLKTLGKHMLKTRVEQQQNYHH